MDGIENSCPGALTSAPAPASIFLALINSLFAAQCTLQAPTVEDYGQKLNSGDEFDFIIVGGGTTGSVIANRLSENPNWKILVLEAGGDPSMTTQIPALSFYIENTDEDWQYTTLPQVGACQGLKDKQCKYPCGKVLGGSSSINTMLYLRGNNDDYNNWARLGNKGWEWSNVLKYFKKSENNLQFKNDKFYHSTGGYLQVNPYSDEENPGAHIIGNGAEEMGYRQIRDFNAGKYIGYGISQGTVSEGTRYSAYRAFIVPVKNRTNLHIAKKAFVTKINFDNKIAKGVNVIIANKTLNLKVKKEVVISVGTLNTPKLLMLSGIGPKQELHKLEINTIVDLPVGENLHDHTTFTAILVALKANHNEWIKNSSTIDTFYNYFMNRKGDLATIGLLDYLGYINTNGNKAYPNVQIQHLFVNKGEFAANKIVLESIGYEENLANNIIKANENYALFLPLPTLHEPKSRGYIKLKSKNPFDMPLIQPKSASDKEDIKVFMEMVKFAERLIRTPTFQRYKPEIINFKIPNCVMYKFKSENYWKCALRNMAISDYHYVGTAKMGPVGDKTAVVTPTLKVQGITNLRVADASIMPKIPRGNTMAPCIMIGEKASDMIKEDWK